LIDDGVGSHYVAAYRKAVHKGSMVGELHLFFGDSPIPFHLWTLPVPVVAGPALGVDNISPGKGFFLVVCDRQSLGKLFRQFIAMGMSDHHFSINLWNPFQERIADGLRKSTGMRSPAEHYFGLLDIESSDGSHIRK